MTPSDIGRQLTTAIDRFSATVAAIPNDEAAWREISIAGRKLSHLVGTSFAQAPTVDVSEEQLVEASRRLELLQSRLDELDVLVLGHALAPVAEFDDIAYTDRLLALPKPELDLELARVERELLTPVTAHPLLIATTVGAGYQPLLAAINNVKATILALIVQLLGVFFPSLSPKVLAAAAAVLSAIINRALAPGGSDASTATVPGANCLYEVRLDYIVIGNPANTGTEWTFDIRVDGLNFSQPTRSLDSDGTFPINRKVARIYKLGCGSHTIAVASTGTQSINRNDVGNGSEDIAVSCEAKGQYGILSYRVYDTGSTTSFSTVEIGFDIESICVPESDVGSTGLIGPPGR